PCWIDYKPAIAHNKIMIIDEKEVITGSFNFTKAAQNKNAENLVIIHDAQLANIYLKNWQRRRAVSRYLNPQTKNQLYQFF
ncbi:MAG: phospholipase D-like domain-containing protein, partial [Candidatus Aquirickettsiella sp.]